MAHQKNSSKSIVSLLAILLTVCFSLYAEDTNQPVSMEPQTTVEVQVIPAEPVAEVVAEEPLTEAVVEEPAIEVAEPNDEIVAMDSNGSPVQNRVLSPIEKKLSKIVSANYIDVPIVSVLSQLVKQADVDIIISPEVTGNVSVSLTNVPLYEALTNILAAHNYGYVTTENMIRVVPHDQIAIEAQKTINRVYHITYADVKEVAKALEKFLSKSGEMAVNPGTSHIMVTDTESKITAIDSFIEELDKATMQVLIEARIYDISCQDNFDLGIQWQAGLTGSSPDYRGATGNKTEPFAVGEMDSPVNKADGSSNTFRFGILNESVDIEALLKAEQEDISATLLANPRVRVLDNESALFKSITEIPYQELQETSAGGTIGTIEFKEVGVELKVTPHVARDDSIRLHVMPKFSVATDSVTVGGFTIQQTIEQPVVDTREADTTLLVKSGQTIVLGGLRKKEISLQKHKVPLLGDIPAVGLLFRYEGERTINSELVLFVTTTILNQPIFLDNDETQQMQQTELSPITEYKRGKVDRKKD